MCKLIWSIHCVHLTPAQAGALHVCGDSWQSPVESALGGGEGRMSGQKGWGGCSEHQSTTFATLFKNLKEFIGFLKLIQGPHVKKNKS